MHASLLLLVLPVAIADQASLRSQMKFAVTANYVGGALVQPLNGNCPDEFSKITFKPLGAWGMLGPEETICAKDCGSHSTVRFFCSTGSCSCGGKSMANSLIPKADDTRNGVLKNPIVCQTKQSSCPIGLQSMSNGKYTVCFMKSISENSSSGIDDDMATPPRYYFYYKRTQGTDTGQTHFWLDSDVPECTE